MGAMIKSLSDYLGQANAPKKKRKLTWNYIFHI
jgi:hypothetical protein